MSMAHDHRGTILLSGSVEAYIVKSADLDELKNTRTLWPNSNVTDNKGTHSPAHGG